jgi:hypothetical protein
VYLGCDPQAPAYEQAAPCRPKALRAEVAKPEGPTDSEPGPDAPPRSSPCVALGPGCPGRLGREPSRHAHARRLGPIVVAGLVERRGGPPLERRALHTPLGPPSPHREGRPAATFAVHVARRPLLQRHLLLVLIVPSHSVSWVLLDPSHSVSWVLLVPSESGAIPGPISMLLSALSWPLAG